MYVGQKLNDLCGVSVREEAFCVLQEVINGNTQMCAENRGGEALALEDTLRDLKM